MTDEEVGGEIIKISTSLIGAIAGLFSPPAGKVIADVGKVAGEAVGSIGNGNGRESRAKSREESGAPYPSRGSLEHKESGVKVDRTYADAILTPGVPLDEDSEDFVPTPPYKGDESEAKETTEPEAKETTEPKSTSASESEPPSSPAVSSTGRFLANLFGSARV